MSWFLVILPKEYCHSALTLFLYIRAYCLIWGLCVVLPAFLSVPANHGIIPHGQRSLPMVAKLCLSIVRLIIGVNLLQCGIKYRCKFSTESGILANSINHWCRHLAFSSINTGAAVYSLTCAPVSAQAFANPFSALSTISSSPNALMKCFVLPVMTNL